MIFGTHITYLKPTSYFSHRLGRNFHELQADFLFSCFRISSKSAKPHSAHIQAQKSSTNGAWEPGEKCLSLPKDNSGDIICFSEYQHNRVPAACGSNHDSISLYWLFLLFATLSPFPHSCFLGSFSKQTTCTSGLLIGLFLGKSN